MSGARPPRLGLWAQEALQIPALLASPLLPPVPIPSGAGQPVMVLPGYLTTDTSSVRLRRSLNAAGYHAHGWELGRNKGAQADVLERLRRRLGILVEAYGEPVNLIGWSLGGIFAREVAKLAPGEVRLVMTLGSPFSGNLRANNAWRIYELLNDHPVDRPPLDVNLPVKPPVQTIALWSARDGIVSASSARGQAGESDLQVEVDCRHLNFARSSRAIRVIGQVLADHLT